MMQPMEVVMMTDNDGTPLPPKQSDAIKRLIAERDRYRNACRRIAGDAPDSAGTWQEAKEIARMALNG